MKSIDEQLEELSIEISREKTYIDGYKKLKQHWYSALILRVSSFLKKIYGR